MRRVGGSGGRFGSCQVESIVYTIKLYQATLTVYPRPLPPLPTSFTLKNEHKMLLYPFMLQLFCLGAMFHC